MVKFYWENVNFVSGQTETKEYQNQWLKLSLKTPQSAVLKVECILKNDLNLSLPDFDEEINREGSSPTRLYGMDFILLGKKIKRADTDGFLANTSRFHFSIYSPPFLHQTRRFIFQMQHMH